MEITFGCFAIAMVYFRGALIFDLRPRSMFVYSRRIDVMARILFVSSASVFLSNCSFELAENYNRYLLSFLRRAQVDSVNAYLHTHKLQTGLARAKQSVHAVHEVH